MLKVMSSSMLTCYAISSSCVYNEPFNTTPSDTSLVFVLTLKKIDKFIIINQISCPMVKFYHRTTNGDFACCGKSFGFKQNGTRSGSLPCAKSFNCARGDPSQSTLIYEQSTKA